MIVGLGGVGFGISGLDFGRILGFGLWGDQLAAAVGAAAAGGAHAD